MDYGITTKALMRAQALEIDRYELFKMVRASAPVTHDLGNRRYEDLVFKLERETDGTMTVVDVNEFAISCTGS